MDYGRSYLMDECQAMAPRGRQGALADDRHPNAGAIVVPPKESQPERGR